MSTLSNSVPSCCCCFFFFFLPRDHSRCVARFRLPANSFCDWPWNSSSFIGERPTRKCLTRRNRVAIQYQCVEGRICMYVCACVQSVYVWCTWGGGITCTCCRKAKNATGISRLILDQIRSDQLLLILDQPDRQINPAGIPDGQSLTGSGGSALKSKERARSSLRAS